MATVIIVYVHQDPKYSTLSRGVTLAHEKREDDGRQVNEFYTENEIYRNPSNTILQITYTFMSDGRE